MKKVLTSMFGLVIAGACLFGSAGRLDWANAWVLLGLNLAAGVVSSIIIASDAGLNAERSNVKAGKDWDKPIVAVVVLIGPMATWITAGLDERFHWSGAMAGAAMAAGVAIAAMAAALIAWSMYANRFFSAVVRIQRDRGHVVISDGPYGFVRHPGYAGIAAFTLATPLILNSRWAFLPAALTAGASVLRTALEDRTLRRELDGYAEYAGRVRSRLIPLIW